MNEETIFATALEKPSSERAAYLADACGDDEALRKRMEGLLAASEKVGNFMANPAVAAAVDPAATEALPASPDGVASVRRGSADPAATDEEPLTFLAPPTRPDSLGRIGHYEILQVLGRGGFGIVFRAFDEMLQRVVALKVMAPQLAATSPARKRFLREARSSAQVRHENVVQVYEIGEQPLPYLAMEFIPGETLQQKLDRVGPLDVPEALRIGRQIADGLAAAHATDLIHRDIKPGNVLLEGGQQKVKITDFGLARTADDASISQSGIIAGTPMYMAPEQAQGQTLDQRADLFSLGSVLYQMVAGRPPFRASTAVAVLKRVAEDQPRAIREIIPETPQWLCDIIAKLHAKNPDDRYQSAREVADVLADCERQLQAHARLKDYSRIPERQRLERRPRRVWKWAAAALAMLLLGGVLWQTPAAKLYFGNRGELEFAPDPGLAAVRVMREGIPVTGWIDVGNRPSIQLSPGRYQLEATLRTGHSITQWELRNVGGFSALTSSQDSTTCDLDLERGQRLNVRVITHDEPPAKDDSPGPVAKQEPLPPTFTNSIGMEFVRVPKGKSWLGGGKDKLGDKEVEIPADFYLGKYEVTQEEWEKVMGNNPSAYSRKSGYKDAVKDLTDADLQRLPVESVTWDQCQLFVVKLNQREREAGWEYRLPSEEEWEYACRGGPMSDRRDSAFDFYFARPTNTLSLAQANFNDGLQRPDKVGSYAPNVLGLYDMHGNVEEWCNDPTWVARGGGLRSAASDCRAQSNFRVLDGAGNSALGLRLVRVRLGTPAPKTKTLPLAVAPFTDSDVQRIAALPAAQQVEEVRKELKRRNPGFDGKMETKIEGGVVTEFRIVTDKVTDIAPIRVWTALRVLDFHGTYTDKPNGLLADLTPLKGMNLAALTHLGLGCTKVTDAGMVYFKDCKDLRALYLDGTKVTDAGMVYFKDCKDLTALRLDTTKVTDKGLVHFQDCKDMTYLNLSWTKVSDAGLALFKDCKALTHLALDGTNVSDVGLAHFKDCKDLTCLEFSYSRLSDAALAHFKGLRLMSLWIDNTDITDLTPLQGMPLEDIRLTPKNITRGLDTLRDMKSLKTIGIDFEHKWPAAEFWERYDKGEFK